MNTTQIHCFLTLANTLNYTRAAAQLYMTQPGLSRQIVSLEKELNTLLFIRDQKSVRLTPAGALLASELGGIQAATEDLVGRVRTVGQGYSGTLTVGLLEGQWMGTDMAGIFRGFMDSYQNIDLRICQGSFSDLRSQLLSGKLDVIFTLRFELESMENVDWIRYREDNAVFAVSRSLPLGKKQSITREEMLKETMLVISPEDSRAGAELLMAYIKSSGAVPGGIRYAPNLITLMLWIEAGLGVGIISHHSSLASNPAIRLIEELPLEDASPYAVWRKDNLNPAVPLFMEKLTAQAQ